MAVVSIELSVTYHHLRLKDALVSLGNLIIRGCSGCEITGSRLFYGHEILNVEFTNEENIEYGTITECLEDQLKVENFQPYRKTLYPTDDEGEQYIHFEVIDGFHEKFGPAVMTIKKQHVVGVGADGVEMYKNGRLCWLQIATKNKVYLFDILSLGARAFKNGLTMILENKCILKVIHDCRAIGGCLMAQFGVKLTNVFDTQVQEVQLMEMCTSLWYWSLNQPLFLSYLFLAKVADVLCFHSETGGFLPDRVSTLQEVVSLHLKVPSSQLLTLKTKSQLTKEETEMWYKRPCPLPLLKVMALSVIHLQPVRLMLLDSLLTDYMALVDAYLSNSQYPLDYLESINLESVIELPSEFRLLEQMRRERQERATKLYPITEKGLLSRASPGAASPPQTSPLAEGHKCTQSIMEPSPPAPTEPDQNQLPLTVNVAPPDPVPNTLSESVSEMTFSGVGRGCAALMMGVIGRGRHFVTSLPPPHFQQRTLDSDTTSTDPKREKWEHGSLWE
ncbi:piRNA biogenesis protein EXD1 isoform X2 [Phyllopteryx taeniolatus]|uniref:piRNA biogenesis protein EXD1 isoform X2 n=1 Tax=Phyllopteryx taeniolatus TaxID=161469 RepID=UPI002AD2CF2E|nr:piRNA biogenesis protein EXD1 isoform X2 [Phyllopteryx taeniolatus]